MMEYIVKITAICLVAATLTVLVRKSNPELALLLASAACVIVLLAITQGLDNIYSFWEEVVLWSGLSTDIFSPLWKTVGIALLTRIGAELCKDAGENAMAGTLETAGAFCAILVAMPLFQAVWEMLRSLI